MVSCIVLAAGESRRFGSPKQLAKFTPAETLIEHLVSTLKKTKIDEIIVVLGAHKDEIQKVLPKDVLVCVNENYKRGQTSSLKIGLKRICDKSSCFLIQPVDMPTISETTFDYIIKKFKTSGALIGIPTYQGKRGHPPIYDIKLKNEILNLNDDEPLYLINRKYAQQAINIEVKDSSILTDINSPEDLEKLKR